MPSLRKSIKSAIRVKLQTAAAISAQLDALYLKPDEAKLAQMVLEINHILSELMILLGQLENTKSRPVFLSKVLRWTRHHHLQLSIHLRHLFAKMRTFRHFQEKGYLYTVLIDERF